jgi:hypothetical protein
MEGNYLERIVVAGSRRAASARPAVSGPPQMPGSLWLPLMHQDYPIGLRPGEAEGNDGGSTALDSSTAPIATYVPDVGHQGVAAVLPAVPDERQGRQAVEREDPVLMAPRGLTGTPRLPAQIAVDDDPANRAVAQQPVIRMPQTLRRVPNSSPALSPAATAAAPLATTSRAQSDEGRRPARPTPEVDAATPGNPADRAGSPPVPDVKAIASTRAERPAVGSLNPASPRVETVATTSSRVSAPRIVAAQPSDASYTARTISEAESVVTGDPAPAALIAPPPMPRPERAETEAFPNEPDSNDAATPPQVMEPGRERVAVPESHWMATLPSIPAARANAESRITIGRVEVQVNNLSPQVPVAIPSRATSAAHSASAFLPRSYYLDRFFLRP